MAIAERVGPTPETAAKLESDIVRDLFFCGKIRQHHWDAALEIRMMSSAIGRGMFPAFRPREGGHVATFRALDFLDRMSPAELKAYERHYTPWANGSDRYTLAITWDVVINNNPADDLDALASGLQAYAEIAGFCSRKRPLRVGA